MRAILVCVDYSDILSLTLPYNKHHFTSVTVVTSDDDLDTFVLCRELEVDCIRTNLFYANGAMFNKWAALEHGLDLIGRFGWLCLMDADVLWPREAKIGKLELGCLYTPMRRMCESIPAEVPPEDSWANYPLHPQQREWAGYTQIFHADDPALAPVKDGPWHETNWTHAGGADSFFQRRWLPEFKRRPPFEVLHLGPAGVNWAGRTSARVDGSVPDGAAERQQQLRSLIRQRRSRRSTPDPYAGERIRDDSPESSRDSP